MNFSAGPFRDALNKLGNLAEASLDGAQTVAKVVTPKMIEGAKASASASRRAFDVSAPVVGQAAKIAGQAAWEGAKAAAPAVKSAAVYTAQNPDSVSKSLLVLRQGPV